MKTVTAKNFPVFAYPMDKPVEYRTFMREENAMSWLNKSSGLWAGLTMDAQGGIYQDLENKGWSTLTDPTGQRFVACMHWN